MWGPNPPSCLRQLDTARLIFSTVEASASASGVSFLNGWATGIVTSSPVARLRFLFLDPTDETTSRLGGKLAHAHESQIAAAERDRRIATATQRTRKPCLCVIAADGPWGPEQKASGVAKDDGADSSARDGEHCDQGWAAEDKMSAILSLLSCWMRSRGSLVEVCLRTKYLA